MAGRLISCLFLARIVRCTYMCIARLGIKPLGAALVVDLLLVFLGAGLCLGPRLLAGRRLSGNHLPLQRDESLHLACHDLCEIKPQAGARRRARPSTCALWRRGSGASWHQRGWWHLEVTGQVHGGL